MSRIKYLIPIIFVTILLSAHHASASVSNWQKGFSIIPQSTTDFSSASFRQSLQNLKSTGANYVTLIVPFYQNNINSTTMQAGANTPTDDSLASAIDYAHSLGMAVNLNFHLESYDTNWRADINPANRDEWFTNYGLMLNRYALIAQNHNVEMLTLGAELINMTSDNINATNTANWRKLIATIRSIYNGLVTYDGNWGGGTWNDELDHIKFWGDLDFIGVSAYYHIGGNTINSYTASSLATAWSNVDRNQIQKLHNSYGKPVLFTEVGYRSVDGALTHPASWQMSGQIDQQEQMDGYNSLFSYWSTIPYFAGVHFWDWNSNPNAGGPNDSDFTIQGKLAQQSVTSWFTNNSNSPPPTGEQQTYFISDLAWKYEENGWGPVERDSSNGEQSAGDGKKITLNGVMFDKGIGGNAKSKIIFDLPQNCTTFSAKIGVDDEITTKGSVSFTVWRDETGQKMYDSGLLTYASPTKSVSLNITGWKAIGLIIYDGGNGPGHDHGDWADAKVTCAKNSPPTSSPILNIVWPQDGSTVTGTSAFKASIQDMNLNQYQMYWQVDSDRLNPMYDSNQDSPHKEAIVDVSGWWWRGSGPYRLTFVAKDLNGQTIVQKDSQIFVSH